MSLAASILTGAVEAIPGLSEVVIGIAVGTLVGKLVVRRYERRSGEISAMRVRQLEAAWILAWVGLSLAVGAVLELLSR